MKKDLTTLFDDLDYENETEKEIDFYEEQYPKKMTKKEFIREMLRLQEERKMFSSSEE